MRALRVMRLSTTLILAAVLHAVATADSAPAQAPAADPTPHLKPGQYKWQPDRATSGPVVIIVNLTDQMAYVYRDGIRIGVTTVSTGRPGHVTPTGVFTILQKETMHHSTLYNDAPMPFMERLTWSGVCLHAGGLPGYPSSHGCVHLPLEFSKLLYGVTDEATTTVVIADTNTAPQDVLHPSLLMPEDAPVSEDRQPPLEPSPAAKYVWEPERSTQGPIAMLVSAADKRIYVYRNGIQIGEASVRINDPDTPLTRAVYTLLAPQPGAPVTPGAAMQRWMRVDVPTSPGAVDANGFTQRVRMPKKFVADLNSVLEVGTTLMVTDRAATSDTRSEPGFVVMDSEPPATPSKSH